jgi:hypothetical protein
MRKIAAQKNGTPFEACRIAANIFLYFSLL